MTRAGPWTGWSAATWASARPKWRCAPPSWPWPTAKQVALLCPTTLLAEQRAQTFSDRFADWPVRVVELSRFRSAKEVATAIEGINDGRVDIVIGTHKILSKDVKFKRLGLVIIDEEHRFGVRQKEALKALRAEVDVLTLTATPIPRTLGMSLEGIRDFSVIATAPQKRLAIKTFVRREDGSTLREALLRELKRGGQCYFLHNEVETIHNRRARLEELVPEARIAVAHGQMPERELEQVMKGFYQQRYNVLLCTTIIETGIGVPSANTIVIHRADRFGLAQLHQLRGRVGRSHQAYAYLLTPGEDAITSNARSAWKRFRPWKSWARASTWPCTTWRSAAPARCWAIRSPATSRKWASPCTTDAQRGRARAARGRGTGPGRALQAWPARSACMRPPCCPRTIAPTCTRAWPSTSAWRTRPTKTT